MEFNEDFLTELVTLIGKYSNTDIVVPAKKTSKKPLFISLISLGCVALNWIFEILSKFGVL